tara:strand:- start:1678 stop:2358 length:681 start_codon:yes stop_codon:yes gene_type:complete
MKNIILQHYTGELGELEKLSQANMIKYAEFCGAEYELVQGDVFTEGLKTCGQKMYMLDSKWDEYDIVVMIDIDMFTRKGMTTNIFTEVQGIGMYTDFQRNLHRKLWSQFPTLIDTRFGYWGGAIYRLTKEQRKMLRSHINMEELITNFNDVFQDEGMMARLATLARIPNNAEVLPGGFAWCHCSYRKGIENSEMIHIRPTTEHGTKGKKIENYYNLVNKGLICSGI